LTRIDVVYIVYQIIVVVGAALHWLLKAQPRTGHRFRELVLQWSVVVNVGVAGLLVARGQREGAR
jgi:hypothetical protein